MRDQRRVSGAARLLRGVLAAVLAVGSAALAHSAAGHHNPHAVVLLFALVISVPVSVALSSVRLSRSRLAAAVLSSQGILHVLFALFPASGITSVRQAGGGQGHHHHQDHPLILETTTQYSSTVSPDTVMTVSHLMAAALTYALLRRGELVLHALTQLLSIRPSLLLAEARWSVPVHPRQQVPSTRIRPLASDLWPGAGPRTLRGPPLVVN